MTGSCAHAAISIATLNVLYLTKHSTKLITTNPYLLATACAWTAEADERAEDPEYTRLKNRCSVLKVENARLRAELEALMNAPRPAVAPHNPPQHTLFYEMEPRARPRHAQYVNGG